MEAKILVYFIKFLYSTFLFPPGIIIVGLFFLCLYAFRNHRKLAKIIGAFTLVFYLCTISLLSDRLIGALEKEYQVPRSVEGDVIVMLGGGATLDTPNVNGLGHLSGFAANRLLTSAQLYQKLHIPIILSGGKVLETTGCEAEISKVILLGLGVPEDKIIIEDKSLNTTENAMYTKVLLEKYGFKQPVLVTSAFHMKRSVLQFEKAQVTVLPYPTDYQSNIINQFELHQLWPSAGALLNTSLALKEYVGILAVKWY
jgi:uncharacterized SAM-binding protein YcdF (DUF218 family)